MSGAVADLKDPRPLDKRNHAQDPIPPPAERDRGCDQVVGERELVVEQAKEQLKERSHKRSSPVDKRRTPQSGSVDKKRV